MMVEKPNRPSLKNVHLPNSTPQQEMELAQGMVRVNHLYRSALKVAVAQMEILDEEFATLNDRSPIHHIEYRIKTLDSIASAPGTCRYYRQYLRLCPRCGRHPHYLQLFG